MPLPQARIDFYRQGATVSSASVTIASGSTGTVNVFALGALVAGDSVRAGVGGAFLSVSSINPSTNQVTLSNSTGASVTLLAGTRLIDFTNRPTTYADELGASTIGSLVIADSGGRASVYLPSGQYDYVVAGVDAVAVNATQTATLTAAAQTMTWNHTASGNSRLVLVAISWQESTATETLDGVTYGGHAMTRVASANKLDLFYLIDPPTTSQAIVVTWSGSSGKGAAAASLSLVNAAQGTKPGFARVGSGTVASAAISVTDTGVNGLVLGALAVDTVPGTTTATLAATYTALWTLSGGTVPAATRTLGAGAWKASNSGTVTPAWTLGPARPWSTVGVEILPAGTRLYADQGGAGCPQAEFGINALDYPSLQEAIDALPAAGGVVFIPTGTYRLRTGLIINKPNVTLIGEGATTVITPDDPTHLPIDLLTITVAEARLYRLKFDGAAATTDLSGGSCGIVLFGQDAAAPERLDQHCYLENVIVTGNSRFGLWLQDTILLTAINCEFNGNKGDGVRIEGAEPGGSSTTLRFVGCAMSGNGGIGLNIGDPSGFPTGQVSQTFLGCTLEGNLGASIGGDISLVGPAVNAINVFKLEFMSCYFEEPPSGCNQFMLFQVCPNVTVDNCVFFGNVSDFTAGPDRAVFFETCPFARLSSNVMQGFKTEIANFDASCLDGVEMCNRDLDAATAPRITINSTRLVSTSRGVVGLPTIPNIGSLPTASSFPAGSMLWVVSVTAPNKHLQISDGSAWVGY
ncbi:MAG: hypothetical protein ABIP58_02135 [Dehalococcoidia bacterium]